MIIKRNKILNTSGAPGFIRGRKYDMDLDRLGRMKTAQRELQTTRQLQDEQRKLKKGLRYDCI